MTSTTFVDKQTVIQADWLNDVNQKAYGPAKPGDAALVGYLPSGTGAVLKTVQAKFSDQVSVKDFGATGDGVTDDSVAVYNAIDYAKILGNEVFFPAGVYRVTYGYTQSSGYKSVFLRGCGRVGEPINTSRSSVILLDSTDASSYFMKFTVNGDLHATGMNFQCAQAVVDRPFFKFQANNCHIFYDCAFQDVERPFVFGSTCYVQNVAYRDVQFRGVCGTFHSENATLACTLMLIDNVNHDGSAPPTNTEKIVCNLTGVRQIFANNFLLEGALPADGWTILKLSNPFDSYYTRTVFAIINNFHSEWSGAHVPTYTVDQVGGTVEWDYFAGPTVTSKYKLSSQGAVVLRSVSFTGTTDDPKDYFELADSQCTIRILNSSARYFDTTLPGINYRDVQKADIGNGTGQIILSNTSCTSAYKWDGGYWLAGGASSNYIPAGSSNTPSTDATYGRKMIVTPDGSGVLNQGIHVPLIAPAGTQVTIMMLGKAPTFASGSWANMACDIGTLNRISYNGVSGSISTQLVTAVALEDLTFINIVFSNGTTPGATGGTSQEIYALEVFVGNDIPRILTPTFPKNILTYNSAAPAAGTWKVGDIVKNNAPAVGQPKGWVCTVAGTPGTWVSEGNL